MRILLRVETARDLHSTPTRRFSGVQTAGGVFNVTVNAVDANWNVVSSVNTVGITSSDVNASLPANAALVGGRKSLSVALLAAGCGMVMAKDITDGTKTANTSPSITV